MNFEKNEHLKMLKDDERKSVYKIFKERIPFTPWGIDWEKFDVTKLIDNIEQVYDLYVDKEFYIIWNGDFPIIKCDLCIIVRYYDEICAVESDTWLFSSNYENVIEIHHEGKITVGKLVK